MISRKNFIIQSVIGTTGLFFSTASINAQQAPLQQQVQKGPPLDPALVREFVGAAHKDIAKVKSMLITTPDLLNSVNNLGGWDWEDAIGAAGHVGIPDLANFLLEQGGRITICVAAMLGKIEIVKSSVEAFPYLKDAVGPHKISLMRHAKAGGENARVVVEYLKSKGVKEA